MNFENCRPDTILHNGNFHTQDEHLPLAQAVAIGQGRIIAVGDDRNILDLSTSKTEKIDLQGKLGLPGFMDPHFHYHEWAFMRKHLNLAEVSSFSQCLEKIRNRADALRPGEWIIGQGFNDSDWPENRMPLKKDLDEVAPDHPTVVWRCDLHLAVANSKALEITGIDDRTPNPPMGIVEKDHNGKLTGVLRELAINLVKAPILDLMEKDIVKAMREGIPVLNRLGLTALHDIRLMGGVEGASALRAWQMLNETSPVNMRTWVTLPGERLDEAAALGLQSGYGNDRLRIGHLKYFADGGMGARTAFMLEKYLDAEYGMPLTPMEELEEALLKAERAGLSIMVHAIGDRTNRELVSLFEKVSGRNAGSSSGPGSKPLLPHRIEHIQMIRPEDIRRLANLGVVGCVQPHNVILDINMIDASVGENGRFAYPFRELLDSGTPILFSSDCPVCDPSPVIGIHAAVTRQRSDRTPEKGWYPEQRVTVDEAVRAYTLTPAVASGAGDKLGSISPGKYADIIILEEDIYTIDPADIHDVGVTLTLLDGKVAVD